jgi:hypothetical protein
MVTLAARCASRARRLAGDLESGIGIPFEIRIPNSKRMAQSGITIFRAAMDVSGHYKLEASAFRRAELAKQMSLQADLPCARDGEGQPFVLSSRSVFGPNSTPR